MVQWLFGKCVLLYGKAGYGKTTFLVKLAKRIYEATGKKARLYLMDTNTLETDFSREIRDYLGNSADVLFISYPRSITRWLSYSVPWQNYSMVVVDSISGVAEELADRYEPDNPQLDKITTRYSAAILNKLARISHRHKLLGVLVAHASDIWQGDFFGEKLAPKFCTYSMKNADVVMLLDKRSEKREVIEEGKAKLVDVEVRYVKIVFVRKLLGPCPYYKKEYLVEDIVGD